MTKKETILGEKRSNIDAPGNDRVQVKWWIVSVPTWISTLRVKDCRVTTATQSITPT